MDILEKKQSDLINASRFPLIILVVLIHGRPAVPFSYSTVFANVDLFEYIFRGMAQNLATIAVPCFFVISGFLFFKGIDSFTKQIYITKLKGRLHTLLLPYLLWNVIFIFVIWLKNCLFIKMGFEIDDMYNLLRGHSIIELFWTREFPVNYPLWYLRDLICMLLLTPIFYLCNRYLGIFGLLILIVINLLGININIPGLSINAITYFGIGSYLALNKKNIVEEFSRFKYIFLIGAVCFAILAYYFIDSSYFIMINRWYVLLGVVTFFNVINFYIQNNKIKYRLIQLSAPVFFIFCVHGIYLIEIIRGFFSKTFLAYSEWGLITSYFLITFLVLSICTISYYVLKRLFPSVISFLLGGRKQILSEK